MDGIPDKYVNPLTDFGFKKLFGSEPNKDLLIDFLNQLLPEHHQIESLTYASNEHLGGHELDRRAVFDLYCIAQSGERFIVEVQKAKQNFFKDRSVFYASFPIREQAKTGEWNFQLKAVYTVGVLDFIFDESESNDVVHLVELKDQHCRVFYDKLKFIYIELPRFKKDSDNLDTQLDKWLYVLRHLSRLNDRPRALQERVFQKLFAAAEVAQFSPDERVAYQNSLKHYWDMNNVVETSREEGREEGIEEGIEIGQQSAMLQVAKSMLQAGEPIEKIISFTGLDKQDIEALRSA
ncbi:MAG: Rpn family recombination-promoting nuclease/putative transposase [Bacteroidota bacterium]